MIVGTMGTIPFLALCPRDNLTHMYREAYIRVLIAAVFIIEKPEITECLSIRNHIGNYKSEPGKRE